MRVDVTVARLADIRVALSPVLNTDAGLLPTPILALTARESLGTVMGTVAILLTRLVVLHAVTVLHCAGAVVVTGFCLTRLISVILPLFGRVLPFRHGL